MLFNFCDLISSSSYLNLVSRAISLPFISPHFLATIMVKFHAINPLINLATLENHRFFSCFLFDRHDCCYFYSVICRFVFFLHFYLFSSHWIRVLWNLNFIKFLIKWTWIFMEENLADWFAFFWLCVGVFKKFFFVVGFFMITFFATKFLDFLWLLFCFVGKRSDFTEIFIP